MMEISKVQPAADPEPRGFMSMPALAQVLFTHRLLLFYSSLGGAILLFCLSFLVKTTYKATALIMPPDHSSSSLSLLSSAAGASIPAGAFAALNMKSSADTYVALMQSPVVEDTLIKQFGLQALYKSKYPSQVRKTLESNTQIVADAKSGLISVSVIDTDPKRAANMANATVDALDKLSGHLAITDAAQRRLFFERQVAETRDNLASAENALQSSSARTGILEPGGTTRAMIGYEEQLRAQVGAQNVKLQSLRTYDSDENPQVQTAKHELAALQAQLNELNQKTNSSGPEGSKAAESSAALEYERKLRDVRYNETLFELMMKNLEAAKLDEAREGSLVQVVSMATPPDMKDGPHRSFFLVSGFILGLLSGVLWLLLRLTLLTVLTRTDEPQALA